MSGARRAAIKGGRFTPKGTPPAKKPRRSGDKGAGATGEANEPKGPAYASSGRYTAPVAQEKKAVIEETKPWVVPVMVVLLLLGLGLIVNYYVGVLPGERSGFYLLGGLVAIMAGFGTASQLK
jgi:hypothetical protein